MRQSIAFLFALAVCDAAVPQYGVGNYTEYHPGTIQLILSVPHGGDLKPAALRNRDDAGCYSKNDQTCVWTPNCAPKDSVRCSTATVMDAYTRDLALEISDAIEAIYGPGKRPHVVLNNLHRIKFDANRNLDEATFGDVAAGRAFVDYHAFIEIAKAAIGYRGLFIDVHGQSVSNNATQIGVLLGSAVLNARNIPDDLYKSSSIKNMYLKSNLTFDDMVRGQRSFGGQLSAAGYRMVPSPSIPGPGSFQWFNGGYNTVRYSTGLMDAIQIETHSSLRFSAPVRKRYAADVARVIVSFLDLYF